MTVRLIQSVSLAHHFRKRRLGQRMAHTCARNGACWSPRTIENRNVDVILPCSLVPFLGFMQPIMWSRYHLSTCHSDLLGARERCDTMSRYEQHHQRDAPGSPRGGGGCP